jgi:hypothetical protein
MANASELQHGKQDPDAFLMGGGVPSASFLHIGDGVAGTITESPTLQQQRDFTSGEPKVWDDGNPMMQLVVTLQTDQYDEKIEDDDGRRRIYVKNAMKKAIADAVRKAGAKKLDVGGVLSVRYTADGEAAKKGINPPKLYTAQYTPPAVNYLNDQRSEDEPQQPHHPRANSNGHWDFDTAIKKAAEVGLDKAGLIAELKKHGRQAYNAVNDTALVRQILNERHKASAFSGEVEFDESSIPF